MSNRLPRRDRMKDHPGFAPTCDDTGEVRLECPCPKCTEHRAEIKERLREESIDREWERREASRRYDRTSCSILLFLLTGRYQE